MTVNVKSVGNKEYYEKFFCWTMDLVLPQNRGGEVESFPEKADIHSHSPGGFTFTAKPAYWPKWQLGRSIAEGVYGNLYPVGLGQNHRWLKVWSSAVLETFLHDCHHQAS